MLLEQLCGEALSFTDAHAKKRLIMIIKRNGNTVEITAISADWKWDDTFTEEHFANGIPINFILFDPAAASEEANLYHGTDEGTAPRCFTSVGTNANDQRVLRFHGAVKKLFLDYNKGTYANAATSIIIELWPLY